MNMRPWRWGDHWLRRHYGENANPASSVFLREGPLFLSVKKKMKLVWEGMRDLVWAKWCLKYDFTWYNFHFSSKFRQMRKFLHWAWKSLHSKTWDFMATARNKTQLDFALEHIRSLSGERGVMNDATGAPSRPLNQCAVNAKGVRTALYLVHRAWK